MVALRPWGLCCYRTEMLPVFGWELLGCMILSLSGVGGVERRWCCEWVRSLRWRSLWSAGGSAVFW